MVFKSILQAVAKKASSPQRGEGKSPKSPRRGTGASEEGLPARPRSGCQLDGPCCYLVDKNTWKGVEWSKRIKIYLEMT